MCGVKKYVIDYPSITTGACLTLPTISYFAFQKFKWQLNFGEINHSLVGEMYLGLAAVAAISGGFAGVIIVFGLTPTSDLFRKFRLDAGDRMAANWVSVFTNSFLAAAIAIIATVLEVANFDTIARFVFAAGCLLLLHSCIRSIWILHQLLTLVRNDDEAARNASLGQLNG